VYQGIRDAAAAFEYTIPRDAFADTDPSAVVRLEAFSAGREPLPSWLQFDSISGTFRGLPPEGRATIEVLVVARDDEGREASIVFRLRIGETAVEREPAVQKPSADADSPDRRPDAGDKRASEDGTERQVADRAGEGGREGSILGKQPVKRGALPFSEQIRAAKTARDSVLAKILASRETRNGRTPL
jgi:hypothetical protein